MLSPDLQEFEEVVGPDERDRASSVSGVSVLPLPISRAATDRNRGRRRASGG